MNELQANVKQELDWTTIDGIISALQDVLELSDYGTEFQIFQNGMPINEETARHAIIGEITTLPTIEKYRRILPKMMEDRIFKHQTVYAESYLGNLAFEHGDFQQSLSLDGFEVVNGAKEVEKRQKRRTKTQIKKEDRLQDLREKLGDTQNTDEVFYLFHAAQCGYLVRNTTIRFFAQIAGQWGTSTETKIRSITLSKLQEFIDSTGRETLSAISTHIDPDLVKITSCDKEAGVSDVEAVHVAFAKAIVDFLDMDVDIDSIKRDYKEEEADSGFRSIEHWGAGRDAVLKRLFERRRDLDPDKIAEEFNQGYESSAFDL